MLRQATCALIALGLSGPAWGREACQERVLSLRYTPQAAAAAHWCWAASGQMVMEMLGEETGRTCQCRQAEEVLGVSGCCAASCLPADQLPGGCDAPRWPAFVERPEQFAFDYRTTCDALPGRQDDDACDARPLAWDALTAELCAGRPVLASLRSKGGERGHTVVVKGFSTRPHRRVLVLDPRRLCPADGHCEGELDESAWLSYDDYAAGWGGFGHWVDFFGIRRR